MTFLAPIWLLLGALAGLALLLNSRQRRRVEVASSRLWQLIEATVTRKPRLGWPQLTPLLLLQLAIVLLTALALSQPRLGSSGPRPDHTIFVLDVSASMRTADAAPSRFDAALAELERRVEGVLADSGGLVSLILAGSQAELVFARQDRLTAVRLALQSLSVTDGSARWPEAAQWLAPLVQEGEATAVVLLTDGEDAVAAAWAQEYPDLRIEPLFFGQPGGSHAGLHATVTEVDAAQGLWRIDGHVTVHGEADVPSGVAVRFAPRGPDGRPLWDDDDTIVPLAVSSAQDQSTDARAIPFSETVTFSGSGVLQIALAGGGGANAQPLHFVLQEAPRALRILLVGREDAELLRSLRALGHVEVAVSSTGLPPTDAGFDLVVVNDVEVARRPATNVLWIGRARVQGEPEPGPLAGGYISAWRTDHPLSSNVDWASLQAPLFYPFDSLPAGSTVLAQAGELPLLTARTTAQGREVRLTLDPVLSRWTADPSFPILIFSLIDWLGAEYGTALATPCVAGLPCALEARELSATIFGPGGEPILPGLSGGGLLPSGVEERFVPAAAGLYTVERGGQSRLLAVNPSADARGTYDATEAHSAASALASLRFWWWIALAVIVLLLVEAWISGRGTERFLVLRSLAPRSPHVGRRYALLALRVGALASITAALLSLALPMRAPERAVVAVVGADWLAADNGAVRAEILQRLGSGSTGLVVAGNQSRIARDIAGASAFNGLEAAILADALAGTFADQGTHIERSLQLASAMLPADLPGQILLATEGQETLGSMGRMLDRLTGRGQALDLLHLPPSNGALAGAPVGAPTSDPSSALSSALSSDRAVTRVDVPPRVYQGDSYPLNAFVYSREDGSAVLTVLRDGEAVATQTVALRFGTNRIETLLQAEEVGPALIEVIVQAQDDPFPENNRNGAIVEVVSPAGILVVTPESQWGEYFAQALEVQGLSSQVVTPANAPQSLDEWLGYDLVVLMNMPALALGFEQQLMLEEAVQVHGRGLFILGGERAFGPGGYYETPLEDMSPLSSLVPQESPPAALVFVLDRSFSMALRLEDNTTRMAVAKAATANAIALLGEQNRVALVAFDDVSEVLYPLQVKDDEAVRAALEPVSPTGGTVLYPAFEAALDQLETAVEEVRHIVIMTDGIIEARANFPVLTQRAQELGVTVSTVAIRPPTQADQLEEIARQGGGIYHTTTDFFSLPSILSQETLSLSGSLVTEAVTPVFWVDRSHAFLADLPDNMPPLAGYVSTTLKPRADLHLGLVDARDRPQPVLASWHYGSGRVLAFASHGAGSGAQFWMALPQYPRIWAQAIRHFLPNSFGEGLHLTLQRRGDRIDVLAWMADEHGTPISQQEVFATLDDDGRSIQLIESEPGRYVGQLEVLASGTHRVAASSGELQAQAWIHVGYPARLDATQADLAAFTAMATATGGTTLNGLEEFSEPQIAWLLQPQWRPWLILAFVLIVTDLLLRYWAGLFGLLRRKR